MKCDGRGWYAETDPETKDEPIPDWKERYCDCVSGDKRRKMDGAPPRKEKSDE